MSTEPETETGTPAEPEESEEGQAKPDLGDAGKKALTAERKARREAEAARKAAEDQLSQAEETAAKLREAAMSDQERKIEEARREAATAARRDEQAKAKDLVDRANRRIVAAEAVSVAAANGVRPEKATRFVRLLDLDDVTVDGDGQVDTDALAALVEAELADWPEFQTADASSQQQSNSPASKPGRFDGGARKPATTSGLEAGRERARKRYPQTQTT